MKYFTKKISTLLSTSLLLCSTTAFALSGDAQEGKELYADANCNKCHGMAEKFNITKHKAKDMKGIQGWVSSCDNALETGWFPEEQAVVAKYLNEAHYKYGTK